MFQIYCAIALLVTSISTVCSIPPGELITTTVFGQPVSFLTASQADEIQNGMCRSAQALQLMNIFEQRILKRDSHADFEFLNEHKSIIATAVTIITLTPHKASVGCVFPKETWDMQRTRARNMWDQFCTLLEEKKQQHDIAEHLFNGTD